MKLFLTIAALAIPISSASFSDFLGAVSRKHSEFDVWVTGLSTNGFCFKDTKCFFGEDFYPNSTDPSKPRTNYSNQAESAFFSHLSSSISTYGFEGFEGTEYNKTNIQKNGIANFPLANNGSGIAMYWEVDNNKSADGVQEYPARNDSSQIPTRGARFLLSHVKVTLRFTVPVVAIGFYAYDVGDLGSQLEIMCHHNRSGVWVNESIVVKHHYQENSNADHPDGKRLYFGFILTDTTDGCDTIYLSNIREYPDGFAFDEFAVAGASDTQELCPDGSLPPCAYGDPHVVGFNGQKYTFEGKNNRWFALLSEESFHINVRTVDDLEGTKQLRYINALGVVTRDVKIVVDSSVDSSCDSDNLSDGAACLCGGHLDFEVNGEKISKTGVIEFGKVTVNTMNIPYECKREAVNQRSNKEKCNQFLQSTNPYSWSNDVHASIMIELPEATIIVEASRTSSASNNYRMDVFFDNYKPSNPHGVIGQSFGSESYEEKAFEVRDALDTTFKFSRFV